MTVWAVVPAKPLDAAKGRLAPLLAPAERRALAEALLADVLSALVGASVVDRVLVVSTDPAALALAECLGAHPVPETTAAHPRGVGPAADGPLNAALGHTASIPTSASQRARTADAEATLNAALNQAAAIATHGGAQALLALPADLPLITPGDVAALVAGLPARPFIVLAATRDGGTSALLRQPPLVLPAAFGPESLRAHLRAAAAAGVAARIVWRPNLALDVDTPADLRRLARRIVWRPNLALDVDTPADLRRLARRPPQTRTGALLARWRL